MGIILVAKEGSCCGTCPAAGPCVDGCSQLQGAAPDVQFGSSICCSTARTERSSFQPTQPGLKKKKTPGRVSWDFIVLHYIRFVVVAICVCVGFVISRVSKYWKRLNVLRMSGKKPQTNIKSPSNNPTVHGRIYMCISCLVHNEGEIPAPRDLG